MALPTFPAMLTTGSIRITDTEGRCPGAEKSQTITFTATKRETAEATWFKKLILPAMNTRSPDIKAAVDITGSARC